MEPLGQELREEREKRNVSLKEMAGSTRISLRYLEALEDDKIDILPGGFFVKGIIRSYARALGLDEEFWIERYRRAGVGALKGEQALPRFNARKPQARISKRTKLSLAGGAAVILAAATFGLYYLTRTPKAPRTADNARAETPIPADTSAAPPPAAAEQAPAAMPPEETGLRIQITFIAETWIQVFSDGKMALDGIRLAGDRAEIRAEQELLINLGNAGGLEFSLNGKPGKSFGASGAVVKNIRITPDNAGRFTADGGTT